METKPNAPAEDEAPQDSQTQVTVQVLGEVQAPPVGASSLDPDPAYASHVALGEAEAAIDIQYMLFYSTPAVTTHADTTDTAPVAPMEFEEVLISP